MDKFFELQKSKLDRLDLLQKPNHVLNADEYKINLNAEQEKLLWIKNPNMFVHNRMLSEGPYKNYGLLFCFWTMSQTNDYL